MQHTARSTQHVTRSMRPRVQLDARVRRTGLHLARPPEAVPCRRSHSAGCDPQVVITAMICQACRRAAVSTGRSCIWLCCAPACLGGARPLLRSTCGTQPSVHEANTRRVRPGAATAALTHVLASNGSERSATCSCGCGLPALAARARNRPGALQASQQYPGVVTEECKGEATLWRNESACTHTDPIGYAAVPPAAVVTLQPHPTPPRPKAGTPLLNPCAVHTVLTPASLPGAPLRSSTGPCPECLPCSLTRRVRAHLLPPSPPPEVVIIDGC